MTPLCPHGESQIVSQRQTNNFPWSQLRAAAFLVFYYIVYTVFCGLFYISHRMLRPRSPNIFCREIRNWHFIQFTRSPSLNSLFHLASRIYTQIKHKSTVLRMLLLFFTPTSNHNFFSRTSCSSSPIRFKPHIHHSLPPRYRDTTNALSTLPKMNYSNRVLPMCLLTFSTTVCVFGLILGVIFVLIHRQREEQLLDDIYHTVCSAIEASDAAENYNCVNGE
ncbi:hypothetical protein DER46DRAFT_367661 [Fusarium sp. MPI-SDFR-AT-0072]|nr:hypothetical protein DER46DRAFT_367661 [Fusarium sp. MPI-SDFR-AT-0072]